MLSGLSGKGWNELEDDLKKVNMSFPPVEKLDGWIPIDVLEDRGMVLARKRKGEKIGLKAFKPEGIWKEVYDKMLRRKLILDAMEEIAEQEDGPASFLPVSSQKREK